MGVKGHELTALHDITHGETLAIVLPGTLRVLKEQKKAKLIQFGERIWGITEGNDDERTERTIEKIEVFFHNINLATRLSEKNIGEETISKIQRRFNDRQVAFGENGNVTGDVAAQILRAAL